MEVAAIAGAATVGASIFYNKRNSDIQKKQYKTAQAAANADYDLKRKQAQNTLSEEQRKNRSLLTRQQSAYKAKLGASGMSAGKGTGQAVLDSMKREHDIEDKYLVDQSNISLDALLNGINQTNSRNLLSMSASSNNSSASSIGDWGNLFSSGARAVIK